MLMEPIGWSRRRADQTARHILGHLYELALAVAPRRDARLPRPGNREALAFETQQHSAGCMCMRLGISAAGILSDPALNHAVPSHVRCHPPIPRSTVVVEGQVSRRGIRDQVRG